MEENKKDTIIEENNQQSTQPQSSSDDKEKKRRRLALGLGLGLGIPALAGITVGIVLGAKGCSCSNNTPSPTSVRMSLSTTMTADNNQCTYANNIVTATKDASFDNGKTVNVDLVLAKAMPNLNPTNDLEVATVTNEGIEFAWTEGSTDNMHITAKLDTAAYKVLSFDAYDMTIKTKDTYIGEPIKSLTFAINKDYKINTNGFMNGIAPIWSKGCGGFITPTNESLNCTWNGVNLTDLVTDNKNAQLGIYANNDAVEWKAQIGIGESAIHLEIDPASAPTDKPYMKNIDDYEYLFIPYQMTSLPDKTIYITCADATGHIGLMKLDVTVPTVTAAENGDGSQSYANGFYDGERFMAATAMTDISTHGTTNLLFSKMSNVPATVKTWTVQHSNPGMEREDPETEMEYDNGIGKLSLSVENAFLVIKPKADSETKYVCDDGGLLLTIRGYDELDKEIVAFVFRVQVPH